MLLTIHSVCEHMGPNSLFGPHISPWIRSRNLRGSSLILKYDGLKINFPVAHEVHVISEDCGDLALLKSWPIELHMIFLIIPTLGCPSQSSQTWNASTFRKITLYATCGTGFMYNPDGRDNTISSVSLPNPLSLWIRGTPPLFSSCVSTWRKLQ